MREITLELDAVRLRALTWGPATGRLAVLLHGFPDTAHTWRHLGPVLADAGWRVVAPSRAATHRPRSPRTAAGTSRP